MQWLPKFEVIQRFRMYKMREMNARLVIALVRGRVD